MPQEITAVLSFFSEHFFFATDVFILQMDLRTLCYDKTMWRKSPTHWMPVNQKTSRISVEFWANDLLSLYLVLAGTHFTSERPNAIHWCKILASRIWHRWVWSVRSVKKQNRIWGLLYIDSVTVSFSHFATAAVCWNYVKFIYFP